MTGTVFMKFGRVPTTLRTVVRFSIEAMISADRASARALVRERQLVGDLGESRRIGVALRGDQLEPGRPLDRQVGIVVADSTFELPVVIGGASVEHVGGVARDAEPVREPGRAIELVEVLVVELE